MTQYIRRTVTITIIETVTLLWVCTNHDDATTALDALPVASSLVACSLQRVTATVSTTLLPLSREEDES